MENELIFECRDLAGQSLALPLLAKRLAVESIVGAQIPRGDLEKDKPRTSQA